MSRFGNNVLKALDTIYRFPGGLRSPSEIDIERPIAVVHDVSEQSAGLASALILHVTSAASAGGGVRAYFERDKRVIYELADVGSRLTDLGLAVSNTDLWLLEVQANISSGTSANLVDATAAMQGPLQDPRYIHTSAGLSVRPVARFITVDDVDPTGTTGRLPIFESTTGNRFFRYAALPQPIGTLHFSILDDATGIASVAFLSLLQVVPKGVRPLQLSQLK